MRFRFAPAGYIFTALLLLSGTGCRPKYAVESAAIDSLVNKNKMALEYLQVDLKTLHERRLEMDSQLLLFEDFQPDTSAVELAINLSKYQAIAKTYKRFIENYDVIFKKVRFHEKQLSALKNSLRDDKITQAEYKMAMQKETNSVNDNLASAEVLGRKVFQMEPDYQRLSVYFDSMSKTHRSSSTQP